MRVYLFAKFVDFVGLGQGVAKAHPCDCHFMPPSDSCIPVTSPFDASCTAEDLVRCSCLLAVALVVPFVDDLLVDVMVSHE